MRHDGNAASRIRRGGLQAMPRSTMIISCVAVWRLRGQQPSLPVGPVFDGEGAAAPRARRHNENRNALQQGNPTNTAMQKPKPS